MALKTTAHTLFESVTEPVQIVDGADPVVVESEIPLREDATVADAPDHGHEVHIGYSTKNNWLSGGMHKHVEKEFGSRYIRREKTAGKDIYHVATPEKAEQMAAYLRTRGHAAGVTVATAPVPRPPKVVDHGALGESKSRVCPVLAFTHTRALTESVKVAAKKAVTACTLPVQKLTETASTGTVVWNKVDPKARVIREGGTFLSKMGETVAKVTWTKVDENKALSYLRRRASRDAILEGETKRVSWADTQTGRIVEGRILGIANVKGSGKIITAQHPDTQEAVRFALSDLA